MAEEAGRPARRTRRHDPHRRERIAEVAEELIAERGLEGLSHRAIAERADVSLSSTTYHFADREALIQAALERAADRFAAFMRQWAAEHAQDTREELAQALADSVMACVGEEGRSGAVVEFELYLAALRRPALREAAARLTSESVEVMTPVVGPVVAACIPPLMNGLCLQVMTAPEPPGRGQVLEVLRQVLGVAPA
ncbi:TetR family transcriptional regulator [Streptomyces sp. BPTC-684]|uniref:TetR/AcrR family transcriptional regulator n=1 Tax=Streptomyces sp. BPTC-684 TaxID=3043734 RepID=UPI0024B0D9E2|nr:TetR family transcriptional regulator [Streptomyces sp. BPTC-684]WHM40772.1 TetR family transcriptional regulator [Streptomyces sp. BPTC-684]